MSASRAVLAAIRLPGLVPDSLGNYLASLGLLRLLARKWPTVRIAWFDQIFHVVGGPTNLEELLDELMTIAEGRAWTPYQRTWTEAQKSSTKANSGTPLANWQASAEEDILELFGAHAVPHRRVSFNPLLGSGGNAGRRAFADGWKRAVDALASGERESLNRKAARGRKSERNVADGGTGTKPPQQKRDELERLLLGRPIAWMLDQLNAASWFSSANRLYNSGQKPYSEGLLSPWVMALACEGLPFWGGGASRRLGAMARTRGAFPFISRAAAPCAEGEAGRDRAEVWAPIWERPMTLPEVRTLFLRGRAEVAGRGALTPGAFATAIVRRGVDAGISRFIRFTLGRTTSGNTFEPRLQGWFSVQDEVPVQSRSHAHANALQSVLELIERLPPDRRVGRRWRFVGLRGPVEAAVLHSAANPEDPSASRALVDAIVTALDRVDRNRAVREKHISWRSLPIEWLPVLLASDSNEVEVRLAVALVSSFPVSRPFATYRFGARARNADFHHPAQSPPSWVWGPGDLARVLARVALRRTLDWKPSSANEEEGEEPVRSLVPARAEDVQQWLDAAVDEVALSRWLSRLALFDWRHVPGAVRESLSPAAESLPEVKACLSLFGLFQPLFDLRPVCLADELRGEDLLPPDSGARTPGTARALASLLHGGQVDAAVRLAASRYAMAGTSLARMNVGWSVAEPDRLLASMLFPIRDRERSMLVGRWMRPRRYKGEVVYV